MFKKELAVSTTNRISNKDRSLIKDQMLACMHPDSVAKFFEDNKVLSCSKISASRMLLYSAEDGTPVIVDVGVSKEAKDSARTECPYFPTMFTLKLYP